MLQAKPKSSYLTGTRRVSGCEFYQWEDLSHSVDIAPGLCGVYCNRSFLRRWTNKDARQLDRLSFLCRKLAAIKNLIVLILSWVLPPVYLQPKWSHILVSIIFLQYCCAICSLLRVAYKQALGLSKCHHRGWAGVIWWRVKFSHKNEVQYWASFLLTPAAVRCCSIRGAN